MNRLCLGHSMPERLTLGIDVGTSATKVLLLNQDLTWEMGSWPSSDDLWSNLRTWLGERGKKIGRVGITTHGPSAIVIRDGQLCGRIIPWHEDIPEECQRPTEGEHQLPNTRAWVPSRLAQWEMENGPIADGVAIQLKDLYNWELTGVIARDRRSMRGYSFDSHAHLPTEVIGNVTANGSELSGISEGAEVICGCDDLTAGVIGLGAKEGVLFNLANTSEHVGIVNGKPIDGMSWLPAIGQLPALSYNATNTRPNSTKDERKESFEKLRGRFNPSELWIGGGLAMDSQIVESRDAIFKAGQEVSVLGVAKLAQRKQHAVIFGAGKVGRGFLAQLLHRSNWDFSLIDSHSETVDALSQNGGWNIFNLSSGKNEWLQAKNIVHFDGEIGTIVEEADLLLTSMGANHLNQWAQSIRTVLCNRLRIGKIDLILAENHPRPALAVRDALLDGATNEEKRLIENNLGIAQAQVLRSCIEPNENQHPLTIQIQDHWTLPLDGEALKTDIVIEGFEKNPHFERELTRKLFTYNCVNAMVSYIGHLAGYEWLADAANDPQISDLALKAGRESSAALVAAYGFDAKEQHNWCESALSKYQDETIRDPIERNARDPIRKLGRFERLLCPIQLCIKHELPYQNPLIGVTGSSKYP